MEGLEADARTASILEQYASGEITLEQMGAEIDAHAAQLAGAIVAGAA